MPLRQQSQRCLQVDAAVIERPATDNPGDAFGRMSLQRRYVRERGDPAGSDDRYPDLVREAGDCSCIDTGECSVARNIGMDDCRYAAILEAACELDSRDLGRLRPALDGNSPVAGIDGNGNCPRGVNMGKIVSARLAIVPSSLQRGSAAPSFWVILTGLTVHVLLRQADRTGP